MKRPKWIKGKKQRGGTFSSRGKLKKIPVSITARKPHRMSRARFFKLLEIPEPLKKTLRKFYLESSALKAGRFRMSRTRAKSALIYIKTANKLWEEKIRTQNVYAEKKSFEQIARELRREGIEVSHTFVSKINFVLRIFPEEEMQKRRIRVSNSGSRNNGVARVNKRSAEVLSFHNGNVKTTANYFEISPRTVYRVLENANQKPAELRELAGV